MTAAHPYVDLLLELAPGDASAWLRDRSQGLTLAGFGAVYAAAGRRLGDAPARLSAEQRRRLVARGVLAPEGWPLKHIARCALVVQVLDAVPEGAQVSWLTKLYRTGDNAEREALLKTLPMLPAPERFSSVAIDACRSHVQTVFEAIACENPYPARHFPDESFNQMVLKGLFTGVAMARIEGLEARRNPELSRMARAYASERRAAGRPVPPDLDSVTG